jgi:tetratricopeptide (TPR) repeat protein
MVVLRSWGSTGVLLLVAVSLLIAVPAKPVEAQGRRQIRAARKQMRAGLRQYKRGEYAQAIEKLKIALALANQPIVLYHIGRAYQAKKDTAQAKYYLKQFLERSKKRRHRKQRADAKKRLEALASAGTTGPKPDPKTDTNPKPDPKTDTNPKPDPKIDTNPKPDPDTRPHADPPRPDPVPDPVLTNPTERPRGRSGLRTAGLISVAVGVGLAATGGYFAKVASDRSDEISKLFDSGVAWDPSYDDLYDEGETARRNSRILLGVGAAAVVGGTVMYLLGRRGGAPAKAKLGIAPTSHGGSQVTWSCVW